MCWRVILPPALFMSAWSASPRKVRARATPFSRSKLLTMPLRSRRSHAVLPG